MGGKRKSIKYTTGGVTAVGNQDNVYGCNKNKTTAKYAVEMKKHFSDKTIQKTSG